MLRGKRNRSLRAYEEKSDRCDLLFSSSSLILVRFSATTQAFHLGHVKFLRQVDVTPSNKWVCGQDKDVWFVGPHIAPRSRSLSPSLRRRARAFRPRPKPASGPLVPRRIHPTNPRPSQLSGLDCSLLFRRPCWSAGLQQDSGIQEVSPTIFGDRHYHRC